MNLLANKESLCMDPSAAICDREYKAHFLTFCSLICILHNKKLNLANIFLLVLKDPAIKELYMNICELDHEYEALKLFLEYDTALHKSKYIKKYLNARSDNKNKK
jgi:hypothetical protein